MDCIFSSRTAVFALLFFWTPDAHALGLHFGIIIIILAALSWRAVSRRHPKIVILSPLIVGAWMIWDFRDLLF